MKLSSGFLFFVGLASNLVKADEHTVRCYLGTKLTGEVLRETTRRELLACVGDTRRGVWLTPDGVMHNDCAGRKWYSGAQDWSSPNRCHDNCRTCFEDMIYNDLASATCVVLEQHGRACWMITN